VKFDADFSEIEGREQEFLDECSRKLGVRCVGVRQGSIILDVEGDPEQTSNALKELENGLDLDGFDPLPVPVILSQSPTAAPITPGEVLPQLYFDTRYRGRVNHHEWLEFRLPDSPIFQVRIVYAPMEPLNVTWIVMRLSKPTGHVSQGILHFRPNPTSPEAKGAQLITPDLGDILEKTEFSIALVPNPKYDYSAGASVLKFKVYPEQGASGRRSGVAGEEEPECNWPYIDCNEYAIACVGVFCFILCFSFVWYFEIYITCGRPYRKKKNKYENLVTGDFDISLTSQPPQDPEPFPMDMDSDMRYENENESGFSQASTPSVGAPNPFWDSIDSFEHESASNKAYDKNDPLIRNLLK